MYSPATVAGTMKGQNMDDDDFFEDSDIDADSWALTCTGWGTDEDYGFFGHDE